MDASPIHCKSNQDFHRRRLLSASGLRGISIWLLASAFSPTFAQTSSEHPIVQMANEPTLAPAVVELKAQDIDASTVIQVPPQVPVEPLTENSTSQVSSYFPVQRPISQLNISVASKAKAGNKMLPQNLAPQVLGDIPNVLAAPASEMETHSAVALDRTASEFPYQPLYFEQVNLERYGRPYRLQAATSAIRFYATIPAIPYAMAVHHANQKYYWRWPYKAGWGAPRVRELPPVQLRAGLIEAGVITGLTFLVP